MILYYDRLSGEKRQLLFLSALLNDPQKPEISLNVRHTRILMLQIVCFLKLSGIIFIYDNIYN